MLHWLTGITIVRGLRGVGRLRGVLVVLVGGKGVADHGGGVAGDAGLSLGELRVIYQFPLVSYLAEQ